MQKEENGEEISHPHPTLGYGRAWERVVSYTSGVRGGAPAENDFIVI